MAFFDRDLGSILRGDQVGISPQEAVSGTVNGTGIDRRVKRGSDGAAELYDSMYVVGQTGTFVSGGTGTSPSVTYNIQDSADNSTFANYTPPNAQGSASFTLSGQSGSASSSGLG